MKLLAILVILSISFILYGAEEGKDKTPPAIKPALEAFESDAKKAWEAYQQALGKAQEKVKKDLDAKMKDATRKADLTTANFIKAKMDEMGRDDYVDGLERKWKEEDKLDLLGNKIGQNDIAKLIVGKWRYVKPSWDVEIKFSENGTFTTSDNYSGKWTVKNDSIYFVISNHDDWWNTMNIPNGDTCDGDTWDHGKKSAKITRIK